MPGTGKRLAGPWNGGVDSPSRAPPEQKKTVERQQKGLCSGRVPRLRYVPAREKPALFINALIREAYRDALGEAPPAARAAFG